MKTKLQFIFLCILAFASTAFAQQEARKFDEMGQLHCDDAKARLDNFAIQLQQEPTAKGYIIFYGGESYLYGVYNKKAKQYVDVKFLPKRGEAQLRIAPWKPYLANNRGVEDSKIEVIDGGYRQEFKVEFWIVPPGAKPPTPTPTLKETEIKFRKGKIKRDEFFTDC
jgi:hypothetical protein